MKFGLNQGAKITALEVKSGTGAAGPWMALFIKGEVGDRFFRGTFWYPNKVVTFAGKKRIDHTDPKDQAVIGARGKWKADIAAILAALTNGDVTKAQEAIIATKPKTADEYANNMIGLLPAGWQGTPVDVFLEWGKEGQDGKRWLELPSSSADGPFICPATGQHWFTEQSDGLQYVVPSSGMMHPFTRTAGYMRSRKANNEIVAERKAPLPQPKVTPPQEDDDDLPF